MALSLGSSFVLAHLALWAGLAPIVGAFAAGLLGDLRSFASASVLGFAALRAATAVAGKLACALAVPRGIGGLAVGLAMMPRGEVGLVSRHGCAEEGEACARKGWRCWSPRMTSLPV